MVSRRFLWISEHGSRRPDRAHRDAVKGLPHDYVHKVEVGSDVSENPMKENQYQDPIDVDRDVGRKPFGLMSNQVWYDDPKRLVFVLARYKSVARLLRRATVLEVIVQMLLERGSSNNCSAQLQRSTSIEFIQDAQKLALQAQWPLDLRVHDILSSPIRHS